jgi:hypothetical protein
VFEIYLKHDDHHPGVQHIRVVETPSVMGRGCDPEPPNWWD